MLAVFQTVLLVLALLAIVASVLSSLPWPYWWTRMFDFPRLQIVALAALVLVLYAGVNLATGDMDTFEWIVAGLLAAVLAYQAVWIAQYSPLLPVESETVTGVPREQRLRLLITNVWMENRDFEKWRGVVTGEDADVIMGVETDRWWAEQMRALEADYPHKHEVPQEDTYGMVVYSRFPLEDLEVKRLVEDEVPSVWARVKLPDGPRVQLVFVHPRPPRPDIGQDSHLRDAELVLVARAVEPLERPVVVAGDFNDVAWSYTTSLFQKLAGLLDPRRGRGLFMTFHADHPLLRYPLDHIFHSDDLALVEIRVLGHTGSDHFPVLVDLAYVADRADQEAPDADASEREQGDELLEFAEEMKAEESPEEERERKAKDV
jgi:endonuclease/exonuclease/phosphatase (EEP) superfamily protein YafD